MSFKEAKQATVSRSSTEAEYRALAAGTAELSWIRQILKDLCIFVSTAPFLFCAAIQLARNPMFHGRTKHVEMDFHFVREKVATKDIQLRFVSSADRSFY